MHQSDELVWRLTIGWCFVAPKTAWSKARRGSIAAALCDRGATKPQAVFGATLRAAVLFASRFVARSSQTAEGYARRSRLAGNENSLRRNTSQLRDTTSQSVINLARRARGPGLHLPVCPHASLLMTSCAAVRYCNSGKYLRTIWGQYPMDVGCVSA